jgi:hypothetical protein
MRRKVGLCSFLTLVIVAAMIHYGSSVFLDVTVATDKPSYVLRESVQVSGTVTYEGQLVEDGLVGIWVEDPLGVGMVMRTIPTGTDLFGNWGVEVISVTLCEDDETPIEEAERGKFAYFLATVANRGDYKRDVVVTINAYDNAFIPVGGAVAQTTITGGNTTTSMVSIWIEKWASVGNAVAYANAYDVNRYPYCPEKAGNFTIIESEYEKPLHDPIPEQPVHNGTYETRFRLPSNPHPGTYEVKARAWYFGFKASVTTTFFVEDIDAYPWPSFTAEPPLAGPNCTIRFDGSFSSPEGYNDTIISCRWEFGDGHSLEGPFSSKSVVEYSYIHIGNYTVTLNVTDSEGFWNTTSKPVSIAEIHDVAITSIQCPDEVYSDWQLTIKVQVKNKGTFTETFSVTVYYDSSIIATTNVVDLASHGERTVGFEWDTTGLPLYVYYTVSAEAEIVINETVTEDNSLVYGDVKVKGLGDIDGDRDIDIYDVIVVCGVYGLESGDKNWDIRADLYPDGIIDIYDVVEICSRYGEEYPSP